MSKKTILENAVRHYAEKIEAEQGLDILSHTFGSWQRDESADQTVKSIKDAINTRHYPMREPVVPRAWR